MNSRKLAIQILDRILNEGSYSNITLSNKLKENQLLDKDKALVTELVYGTIRRLKTLDMIIASFVKDISIMDRNTLNILRVAIYQMQFLDKVPSYAACNEAVELAKEISEKDGKLVNGILRSYSEKDGIIELDFRNKIDEMAYEFSFEPWMIRMFIKQYGEQETLRLLHGLNIVPKVTVRVNALKSDYEEVFDELESLGYEVLEGAVCPEAICIKGGKSIEENPLFKEGKITVQDESAMVVAPLLDLEEGDVLIDVCSAPGGKTTHAAELLQNTGEILAFDLHKNKLELIKENANRLGITNIKLGEMDATKLNTDLISKANKILVDIPCSGLGIIRKKPEIKWTKTRKDLKELVNIQRMIMDNSWEYLQKGGIMVYSTCTLNKEENQENIEWFLEKHKNATIEKIFIGKNDNIKYDRLGTITIFPDENMDGFYIAKLRKN
ncbi:MAG: 16S rRNA (cytosine(967)-C(5))-methyltransferase RsmB [Clostridiales bacterium]|nr:16S rRNA (cytosine(967)-C(5))-methyltransferase RsmB [Clostridiales bacterium]